MITVLEMDAEGHYEVTHYTEGGEEPAHNWKEEVVPAVLFQVGRGGGSFVMFHQEAPA